MIVIGFAPVSSGFIPRLISPNVEGCLFEHPSLLFFFYLCIIPPLRLRRQQLKRQYVFRVFQSLCTDLQTSRIDIGSRTIAFLSYLESSRTENPLIIQYLISSNERDQSFWPHFAVYPVKR